MKLESAVIWMLSLMILLQGMLVTEVIYHFEPSLNAFPITVFMCGSELAKAGMEGQKRVHDVQAGFSHLKVGVFGCTPRISIYVVGRRITPQNLPCSKQIRSNIVAIGRATLQTL